LAALSAAMAMENGATQAIKVFGNGNHPKPAVADNDSAGSIGINASRSLFRGR